MNLKRLYQSFKDAVNGVIYVFKHEQNFRIQIFFAIITFVLIWIFQLRRSEIVVMVLLILLVLILELLNSAVEKLADIVKPRLSYQIQTVKDIMAAMVFLSSIGSLIIGLVILGPHVFELLGI